MTACSQFEDAAKEAADEATSPRPLGEEEVEDIQVMLKMEGNCIQIRQLKVGSWAVVQWSDINCSILCRD